MCDPIGSMTGGGNPSGNLGTFSSNTLDPEIRSRLLGVMDRGIAASNLPYEAYTGQRVSPFSTDQQSGFDTARGTVGAYQPDLSRAENYAGIAAQPVAPNLGTFDQAAFEKYGSPYMGAVEDAARHDINRQYDMSSQGIAGGAAMSDAFGGDRSAIMQAENERNRSDTMARTLSGLRQSNFSQAQSQFNNEQSRQLAAQESDAMAAARASQQYASLGAAQQQLGTRDAGTLLGIGGMQQALGQQQANVDYGDFLEKREYPRAMANYAMGIMSGTPYGAFTTNITTPPTPNLTGQIFGGATALAGTGAFGSDGWLKDYYPSFGQKDGGIVGYASGGAVEHSGPPWLKTVGGIGGSLVGGYFGGPVGSMIGSKAGANVMMGFGDLFDGNWDGLMADAQPPMMGGMGGGGGGGMGLPMIGGLGMMGGAAGGNPLTGMLGGIMGGGGRGGGGGGMPMLSGFRRGGYVPRDYDDGGYVYNELDPIGVDAVGNQILMPNRAAHRYPMADVRDVRDDQTDPADDVTADPSSPGMTTYVPGGFAYGPGKMPAAHDDQPPPLSTSFPYAPDASPPTYPEQGPPMSSRVVPRAAEGERTLIDAAGDLVQRVLPGVGTGEMSPQQEAALRKVPVEQVIRERIARASELEQPTDIAGDTAPPSPGIGDPMGTGAPEIVQQAGPASAPAPAPTGIAAGPAVAVDDFGRPIEAAPPPAGIAGGALPAATAIGTTPIRSNAAAVVEPQPKKQAAPAASGTSTSPSGNPDDQAPKKATRKGQNVTPGTPGTGGRLSGPSTAATPAVAPGGVAGTPAAPSSAAPAGGIAGGAPARREMGDAGILEQNTQRMLEAQKKKGIAGAPAPGDAKKSGINLALLKAGAAMMKSGSPLLMGAVGAGVDAYADTRIKQDQIAATMGLKQAELARKYAHDDLNFRIQLQNAQSREDRNKLWDQHFQRRDQELAQMYKDRQISLDYWRQSQKDLQQQRLDVARMESTRRTDDAADKREQRYREDRDKVETTRQSYIKDWELMNPGAPPEKRQAMLRELDNFKPARDRNDKVIPGWNPLPMPADPKGLVDGAVYLVNGAPSTYDAKRKGFVKYGG